MSLQLSATQMTSPIPGPLPGWMPRSRARCSAVSSPWARTMTAPRQASLLAKETKIQRRGCVQPQATCQRRISASPGCRLPILCLPRPGRTDEPTSAHLGPRNSDGNAFRQLPSPSTNDREPSVPDERKRHEPQFHRVRASHPAIGPASGFLRNRRDRMIAHCQSRCRERGHATAQRPRSNGLPPSRKRHRSRGCSRSWRYRGRPSR